MNLYKKIIGASFIGCILSSIPTWAVCNDTNSAWASFFDKTFIGKTQDSKGLVVMQLLNNANDGISIAGAFNNNNTNTWQIFNGECSIVQPKNLLQCPYTTLQKKSGTIEFKHDKKGLSSKIHSKQGKFNRNHTWIQIESPQKLFILSRKKISNAIPKTFENIQPGGYFVDQNKNSKNLMQIMRQNGSFSVRGLYFSNNAFDTWNTTDCKKQKSNTLRCTYTTSQKNEGIITFTIQDSAIHSDLETKKKSFSRTTHNWHPLKIQALSDI